MNVNKVELQQIDKKHDYSNELFVPISKLKIKIDPQGNIEKKSLKDFDFDLKEKESEVPGAFILKKENSDTEYLNDILLNIKPK